MEEQRLKEDEVPERDEVLENFRSWIDIPMLLLGLFWLILLIIELTHGLGPTLEFLTAFVWVLFVVEFAIELTLSSQKTKYLRQNWLVAVSLIVPALRILRVVRVLRVLRLTRAVRSMRLLKIIGSLNRAINGLRENLGRYGAGYVGVMSFTVTIVGAAGMYAFESNLPDGQGLNSYGDALWWTAMIMTTIGSQYWPITMEGRLLGFLLSLYAFSVFGYVTGALASFFIGRHKEIQRTLDTESLNELRREIGKAREELAKISSNQ
jgi:voltage-gated potassium channel